jgi:hypothetical protein
MGVIKKITRCCSILMHLARQKYMVREAFKS